MFTRAMDRALRDPGGATSCPLEGFWAASSRAGMLDEKVCRRSGALIDVIAENVRRAVEGVKTLGRKPRPRKSTRGSAI
jgi:ribosomal protein L40E